MSKSIYSDLPIKSLKCFRNPIARNPRDAFSFINVLALNYPDNIKSIFIVKFLKATQKSKFSIDHHLHMCPFSQVTLLTTVSLSRPLLPAAIATSQKWLFDT